MKRTDYFKISTKIDPSFVLGLSFHHDQKQAIPRSSGRAVTSSVMPLYLPKDLFINIDFKVLMIHNIVLADEN